MRDYYMFPHEGNTIKVSGPKNGLYQLKTTTLDGDVAIMYFEGDKLVEEFKALIKILETHG